MGWILAGVLAVVLLPARIPPWRRASPRSVRMRMPSNARERSSRTRAAAPAPVKRTAPTRSACRARSSWPTSPPSSRRSSAASSSRSARTRPSAESRTPPCAASLKKNNKVKASIVGSPAKCKKGSACGALLGFYSKFDACAADGTCAGPKPTTTTTTAPTTTAPPTTTTRPPHRPPRRRRRPPPRPPHRPRRRRRRPPPRPPHRPRRRRPRPRPRPPHRPRRRPRALPRFDFGITAVVSDAPQLAGRQRVVRYGELRRHRLGPSGNISTSPVTPARSAARPVRYVQPESATSDLQHGWCRGEPAGERSSGLLELE